MYTTSQPLSTPADLRTESYDFVLPKEQIASRPAKTRHNSRLLVYHASENKITHSKFIHLDDFLPKDSLLVLNKTKVFPCRLTGHKSSGGKCEIFVLSIIPNDEGIYDVLIKSSRKKQIDDLFHFDELTAQIKKINTDGTFGVIFNTDNLPLKLQRLGKVPIPPYIRSGESDEKDFSDYQTIYAEKTGSVAAPTAGLHFTDEVFDRLDKKGIELANVVLHVGLGTFSQVKTENITKHKMHSEQYFIPSDSVKKIDQADKIFAVGTTSLRVLESSLNEKNKIEMEPDKIKTTNIFLHPGKKIHSIDGIITNFHLPKSTLLMLVSSLIGREKTLKLYKEAQELGYRFFSYGDAMLIIR